MKQNQKPEYFKPKTNGNPEGNPNQPLPLKLVQSEDLERSTRQSTTLLQSMYIDLSCHEYFTSVYKSVIFRPHIGIYSYQSMQNSTYVNITQTSHILILVNVRFFFIINLTLDPFLFHTWFRRPVGFTRASRGGGHFFGRK